MTGLKKGNSLDFREECPQERQLMCSCIRGNYEMLNKIGEMTKRNCEMMKKVCDMTTSNREKKGLTFDVFAALAWSPSPRDGQDEILGRGSYGSSGDL